MFIINPSTGLNVVISGPNRFFVVAVMAELALALSIVSLIKLSNTVLTSCAEYVGKVKNAPGDINKIINEVSGLEFILKSLSKLALTEGVDDHSSVENNSRLSSSGEYHSNSVNDPRLTSLRALHQLPTGGPFNGCKEVLSEISRKLEKITSAGSMQRQLICGHSKVENWRSCCLFSRSTKPRFCLLLLGSYMTSRRSKAAPSLKLGHTLRTRRSKKSEMQFLSGCGGANPSTNHNASRKKHTAGTEHCLLMLDTF